jgi:hypothetical protein
MITTKQHGRHDCRFPPMPRPRGVDRVPWICVVLTLSKSLVEAVMSLVPKPVKGEDPMFFGGTKPHHSLKSRKLEF